MNENLAVAISALAVGLIVGISVYLWGRYGTCAVGRHRWGPWGESYDSSRATGDAGTRRQDRVCVICMAESYRDV